MIRATCLATPLRDKSNGKLQRVTAPEVTIHCHSHREGLEALKFFIDQRTRLEPSTTTLPCLAELVLTLNNFSFDGEHYQQINDVAIGSKTGPSFR